jgi:AhpD family alkylhydroperoxidase
MARISRVSAQDAGQEVELTYRYVRQGIAELTGCETESMIEPLELFAHLPGLLRGYMALEQAVAEQDRVDKRLKALAQLKAATLTHCEYCIDLGSQVSRQWGLTDEELLALPFYQTSPLFGDLEKLVLDYAVGISRTPVEVSDALFAKLREHFDDAQLVELTHLIALENMRGRFNLALGVGAAGFSEGMVCAVPAFVEPPDNRNLHAPSNAAASL